MRSRPVFLLATLTVALTLALPARPTTAGDSPGRAGLLGASTVQLFGSFSPGLGDDDRWGYGAALRWRLSDRFALGFDASRLTDRDLSIAPFGAGIILGPGSQGDLHPWVEVGAAYVRLSQRGERPGWAPALPGSPFDDYSPRVSIRLKQDAWGPYFGAGLGWSAGDHLGIFGGVRAFTWTNEGSLSVGPWDGAVVIRSGLSYDF